MVYDFIITIQQPIRNNFPILCHSFNMKPKCFLKFLFNTLEGLVCAKHSSYALKTPSAAKVFVGP